MTPPNPEIIAMATDERTRLAVSNVTKFVDFASNRLTDRVAEDLKIVVGLATTYSVLRAQYDELLLAVASKCPGETRHQTALRYIREREDGGSAASAIEAATAAESATAATSGGGAQTPPGRE